MTKDAVLRVRLSTKEKKQLEKMAEALGCNISDVVRQLLVNAKIVVRPVKVIESSLDEEY